MGALTGGDLFLFEGFRLDRQARSLYRRDEAGAFVPIAVGSRALDVLSVLVARAGDLVSRDELMTAVWSATAVADTNLNMQIAVLRRVLDEGRADSSCIQTVPGRGYRLVSRVTREDGDPRPRLSIVVLPFANLSNDSEQQYFVDAITEDLTTDLSRLAETRVISCNTAFTYRNKPIDTKQIGRELGVRYVLEGSVRRSDNQIRVNAQLIDAENDAHLWADRFNVEAGDLFALQDEITNRIAVTLGNELVRAEADRPTQHPDALDYIFRGREAALKPHSREKYAEAVNLFDRALALDPQSVNAQSELARHLAGRVMDNLTDTAAADMVRAQGLVERALAASPHSGVAHFAKGQVLRAQRRFAKAIL